ncbi:MAG TPA: heavy metal-associated domain-containing protein [Campylobacterales bacterium]|nr:heavy metal-associated domain-containing protein [Campylobacterales bacterium]
MKHTYEVQNIRCGGCANTINKALSAEFEDVEIDVMSKKVTVEIKNESEISKGAEMLKKLGYPLIGEESGMLDKAKSFVSCAIGKM